MDVFSLDHSPSLQSDRLIFAMTDADFPLVPHVCVSCAIALKRATNKIHTGVETAGQHTRLLLFPIWTPAVILWRNTECSSVQDRQSHLICRNSLTPLQCFLLQICKQAARCAREVDVLHMLV